MSTIFSIAIMPAMAFGSPHHGHQQVAYYPAPQPHRVIERVVYRPMYQPIVQQRVVYQYGHGNGHKRGHWQGRGHGRNHHETRISYRDRW